jgi:sugar lactone lactonase YvrE
MPIKHVLSLSLALAACSDDAVPRGPDARRIELAGATFYPEGVAFDDAGTMYVTSIMTGAVARVENGGTAATELVAANKLGASLVGATMSQKDDLLWLCLGTFGTDFAPAVIGLDTNTGAEVVRHAFPKQADGRTGGLCNEITEDAQGNIYASDSFGARILRIPTNNRTTANSAAVWAAGESLGAMMFGVNGIAFDGDKSILAVNTETGKLFRVGADAAIVEVALERPLAGPDGLRRVDGDTFVVVEQGAGRVSLIAPKTGKVTVIEEGLRTPTSLDTIDGRVWVAEGQLSHLFDMTAPELPFFVIRADLP